jgi:amino acid transporter
VTPDILLHLLARFLHIGPIILLLGGVFYARQVVAPALQMLGSDQQVAVGATSQQRFRGTLWTLLGLIVLSGLYNFFNYAGPKHSSSYQMWFGIKMLLVLHVLATAILWGTSPYRDAAAAEKGKRRLLSMIVSGFLAVFISAYLRSLSQRGL